MCGECTYVFGPLPLTHLLFSESCAHETYAVVPEYWWGEIILMLEMLDYMLLERNFPVIEFL